MSGAKLCDNGNKTPFGANNDRPSGASAMATSLDVTTLRFVVATGNRESRRLATRQIKRIQRDERARRRGFNHA